MTFNYQGNNNFTVVKEGNAWFLNGQETDSTLTDKYLKKLARVTSSNFIDDVEPTSNTPTHIVKIEGNNILPIELRAYPADTVNQWVVTSSLVPDAKYSGAKAGLFERVFINWDEFFPLPPTEE